MYKNLLVPVDGGDLCEQAMRGSIALARQLGATITAFVAESVPPLPQIGRTARQVQIAAAVHDAQVTRDAETVLKRFEDRAREAGVGFAGHHAQALRIEDAIVDAAVESTAAT